MGYLILMGLVSGHILALVVAGVGALMCLPLLLTFVTSIVHPWRRRVVELNKGKGSGWSGTLG